MTRRLTRSLLAAVLGAGLVLTSGGVAAASSAAAPAFTPVVSGLNGPRGVAFDHQGNLYVAEAGQFQPVSGTNFVVSQTGKVDKFSLHQGTATLRWSASFNSLSDTFLGGGPEVLGPAGDQLAHEGLDGDAEDVHGYRRCRLISTARTWSRPSSSTRPRP